MGENDIRIVVSLDDSEVRNSVKRLSNLGSNISKSMSGVFESATDEIAVFNTETAKALQSVLSKTQSLAEEAQVVVDVYKDAAEAAKTLAVTSAGTKAGDEALKEATKLDNLVKKYEKLSQVMQQRLAAVQAELQQVFLANNSYTELSSNINGVATAINSLGDKFNTIENYTSSVSSRIKQLTSDFDTFDKGLLLNNIDGGLVPTLELVNGAVSRVTDSLGRVTEVSGEIKTPFSEVASTAEKVARAMQQVASESDKSAKSVSKVTDAVSLLKKGFKALVSYKVVKFLGDATAKAIAFSESIHTLKVAAGESAKELYKFVNIVSEKFGLDKEVIIRATTAFKQMGKNMGLATESSNILARGFTLMAVDMQALYEIPLEDALSRLESVTTGYGRALKNQGMMATNAYLQEIALSLGITERVASMSEANKVGLRYIAVMRQMENAQDEYAKTIESASNQMRVFKAQVSQTITAIGSLFYNFVSKILPYVNGILMAIRAIISVIAKFFGFKLEKVEESTGGIADNVGGIGDAASDAAKKMKQLVAPFDELNILSEDTADAGDTLGGLGGLDPRILEAMKEYDSLYDKIRMKAHDVRDTIMHTLGFQEKVNEETGETEWEWQGWGALFKGLKDAWNQISEWWDNLSPGARLAAGLVGAFIGFMALSGIGSIVGSIVEIFTGIATAVTTYAPVILGALSPMVIAIIGLIAAIGIAIADLWMNSEEFRNKVTVLVDQLVQKWQKAFDSINKFMAKLKKYVDMVFVPGMSIDKDILVEIWTDFRDTIGVLVLNILDFFNGFLTFMDGVFTADMGKILDGLAQMFGATFQGIYNLGVGLFNGVIDAANWAVNKFIDAINVMIDEYNAVAEVLGLPTLSNIASVDLEKYKLDFMDHVQLPPTDYNEDYRVLSKQTGDYNEDYRVGSKGDYKLNDSYRGSKYAEYPMGSNGESFFDNLKQEIIVTVGGTRVDAEIAKAVVRGMLANGAQTISGGFNG